MTAFQKAFVALGLAALLLVAVLGRYELVVGSRGDASPPAYVLDRWTGKVRHLWGTVISDTTPPRPAPPDMFKDMIPVQPREGDRGANAPKK